MKQDKFPQLRVSRCQSSDEIVFDTSDLYFKVCDRYWSSLKVCSAAKGTAKKERKKERKKEIDGLKGKKDGERKFELKLKKNLGVEEKKRKTEGKIKRKWKWKI